MYHILLLNFISSLVLGSNVQDNRHRAMLICSSYGFQALEARFGDENYLLCLKMSKMETSPLTSHQSMLLLDPDVDIDSLEDEPQDGKIYPLSDIALAYGFPVEDPYKGSAEGYIGEDHHFHGVLHIGNRTLYADPYGIDDLRKLFGFLENDHVAAPKRPRRHQAQVNRQCPRLGIHMASFYRLPEAEPVECMIQKTLSNKKTFEQNN